MHKDILITVTQGLGCAIIAMIFLISVPIAFWKFVFAVSELTVSGKLYVAPIMIYGGVLLFWVTVGFSLSLWHENGK